MKTVKLYHILFEADDMMNIDIGKDVADAVTKAIEPVTKDVEQMKKDINVIQKSSGEKKQEPTKARSTTGADQTSAASTIPKGPGTATTGTTSSSGADGSKDSADLRKDVEQIKTQVGSLTNMAKKAQETL